MNEQNQAAEGVPQTSPEIEATPEQQRESLAPRVYVASLSDYNAGRLHGQWIDAAQEPEEIHADIASMLSESREPGAEEWAIHDFEDFASIYLGEWESVTTISRLGLGLVERGRPYSYWANYVGHEDAEALARFEEAYLGVWESEKAYAQSLIEDGMWEDELDNVIPSGLRPYVSFDYDMLARDLASDLHFVRDGDGVHVFDAR